MRRFVLHTLLFLAIQIAIGVAFWRACPDDPDHYMAATLDKHARLRSAAVPRLIFVGGSSVGFSIDSRAFEGLGLAPVNMGLNDGLGLPFMLGEVAGELHEGDVVIVAPETHLFWSHAQSDAVWAVLQRRPASLACLGRAGPRAVADVFDQALPFLARKVRCALDQMSTDRALATMYRRSSFDAFGDFVAHRDRAPDRGRTADPPGPDVQSLSFDRSIDDLAEFARRCERVGARCFLAWCPLRRARAVADADVVDEIRTRLAREVAMPQLEDPQDVTYEEDAFHDRGPHLTGAAAWDRSVRLAQRLRAALSDP